MPSTSAGFSGRPNASKFPLLRYTCVSPFVVGHHAPASGLNSNNFDASRLSTDGVPDRDELLWFPDSVIWNSLRTARTGAPQYDGRSPKIVGRHPQFDRQETTDRCGRWFLDGRCRSMRLSANNPLEAVKVGTRGNESGTVASFNYRLSRHIPRPYSGVASRWNSRLGHDRCPLRRPCRADVATLHQSPISGRSLPPVCLRS